METLKLKFTTLQNEIFRLLCKFAGKSLNQSEIASILKVSSTAIAKSIKNLSADYINIKKDPKMNLTIITLNRDNFRTIELKRCENLIQIYESGLNAFLEEEYPGSLIILFGSYSYGSDTFGSDIDIAVIGSKEKKLDLKKYENYLEREVIIQHYDSLSGIHKNLRNNVINGIVLKGVIEL